MAQLDVLSVAAVAVGSLGVLVSGMAVLRAPRERRLVPSALLIGVAGLALTAALAVARPPISFHPPVLWGLLVGGAVTGALAGLAVRVRIHQGGVLARGGAWHLLPAAIALLALQAASAAGSLDGVVWTTAAIVAGTAFAGGAVLLVVVHASVVRRRAKRTAPGNAPVPAPVGAAVAAAIVTAGGDGAGTAVDVAPHRAAPHPQQDRSCAACGTVLAPGGRFCSGCGAQAVDAGGGIAATESATARTAPASPRRTLRRAVGLVAATTIAVIGVGYLVTGDDGQPGAPRAPTESATPGLASTDTASPEPPIEPGSTPPPSPTIEPPERRYVGLTYPDGEPPSGVSELSGALLSDIENATSWMAGPEGDMFWLLAVADTDPGGSATAWQVLDVALWPPVTEDSAQVVTGAVRCEVDGVSVDDVAGVFPLADSEWLIDPYAAWRADTTGGRLVPLPASTRCQNEASGV